MLSAFNRSRFLNRGVACELCLLFDKALIAFFYSSFIRGPTLEPQAVIP